MDKLGYKPSAKAFRRKALWMPVLMHGFYDFCLSVDSWWMIGVFFVYIIATDIVIILKIRKFSKTDAAFEQVAEENETEEINGAV